MFFLLRMAFWLGLVLVLLPREKTPESDKLPQIGASEAVQAATAAVTDMTQFCKRQPAACEVGGQAATVIGHRWTCVAADPRIHLPALVQLPSLLSTAVLASQCQAHEQSVSGHRT